MKTFIDNRSTPTEDLDNGIIRHGLQNMCNMFKEIEVMMSEFGKQ